MANPKGIVIMATLDSGGRIEHDTSYALRPSQRFWRNRRFARLRHRLVWLRRSSPLLTRAHARLIRWTGGRIRRSFVFTGGMPLLVLTTAGRKSGKRRSTPLGYLRFGNGYAVIASNAGSDRVPAWWLNLQADPEAQVLADRTRYTVRARRATAAEDDMIWAEFARLNPGFDEYRSLTERPIPVVILEKSPTASASNSLPR
jgi:deazaflavin-dependent oxidoreductase (nitroreductase family)